jgi:hypothetical protein
VDAGAFDAPIATCNVSGTAWAQAVPGTHANANVAATAMTQRLVVVFISVLTSLSVTTK